MDVAIPADLLILLLVLVLPLVSHGVERNLEAFLFVMGTLSQPCVGSMGDTTRRQVASRLLYLAVAVVRGGSLW